MAKIVTIKLTKAGPKSGPFDILTPTKDIVAQNISRKMLIKGISVSVDDAIEILTLKSTGACPFTKSFPIVEFTNLEVAKATYSQSYTGCLWRHLTDPQLYNNYYGNIEPYMIEYPFSYKFQDEILQNVKDYTKVYEYSDQELFNTNSRVGTDNKWFNKAILYNDQQSTGILNLVSKPMNNLQAYNQFPIFNPDSKTIVYSKSDNFYQYNTFWALQKSSQAALFIRSCESLSIDKIVNQDNMDYSSRSFKKAPLRAKDLKVRHILDDRSDINLVSQFILTPSQISFK